MDEEDRYNECQKCGSKHIHQKSKEIVNTCLNHYSHERCKINIDYNSDSQEYICQDCGHIQ